MACAASPRRSRRPRRRSSPTPSTCSTWCRTPAAARFGLDRSRLDVVRRHTHHFLMAVLEAGTTTGRRSRCSSTGTSATSRSSSTPSDRSTAAFPLFSRWDYDWFRIEPRLLDFYFLSRVSSRTGDRTRFTYGAHTLLEPRFRRFLRAYHAEFPLTPRRGPVPQGATASSSSTTSCARARTSSATTSGSTSCTTPSTSTCPPSTTSTSRRCSTNSAEAGDEAAAAERAQHPRR